MRRRRRMRLTFVHFAFSLSLAIGGGLPGDSAAAGREAFAMFSPGTLLLPTGSGGAPTEEVTIASLGVAQLFAQYGVDSVARTFPNFQLAETLGVARTGEIVRLMDLSNIYTLVLGEAGDRGPLCLALEAEPSVVYAEPNGGVEPCGVFPNDPKFQSGEQWHLHNIGQAGGVLDADIDAPEAWEISRGSVQTRIGIIDSGVEATHPDLSGRVSGDPPLVPSHRHGTNVAGIASANTDNGVGIAGVDWHARIESQRYTPLVDIDEENDQQIATAIMEAVGAGSQIVNNSYRLTTAGAIDPTVGRYSTTVRAVLSNAYKLNVCVIAAMGNDNTSNPQYPAAFAEGVIAVGATDRSDVRWSNSNYGAHIDVAAPGVDIVTTSANGTYIVGSGTSASAPMVAGVAGLMLAVNPSLYNDDIEQIIRRTADDLGSPGWDQYYGTGRLNARSALERLLGPYVLREYTATGGTIVSSSALSPLTFMAVPGLPDAQYTVRQHEVQKSVVFPIPLIGVPDVWGRGVATVGFSDEGFSDGRPNFGLGWCEPVPGSVTLTGCGIKTFIYEVFDDQGGLIGWFPTTAANVSYAYAVLGIDLPSGGGCPFVDTRSATGWREENSVMARSLTGSMALDAYRLKFPPNVRDGKLQVRLRENEQEFTILDQVRLVTVDHAAEVRAYALGDRIVLGTREAACRVTTSSGRDVTGLVSGQSGYYLGRPGDTLLVEMTPPARSGSFAAQGTQDDPGGPGLLDGDPKEMEVVFDDEFQARMPRILGAADAVVLGSTGLRVEVTDGTGGWRTLTHYYPRRYRDEMAVDSLGSGSFRLIFVGRHRLHFIGRVVRSATPASIQTMNLLSARHSRLGDAFAAVTAGGGAISALAPGDTLALEFAATSVPAGQVRETFLLSTGVYSSDPFVSDEARDEGRAQAKPTQVRLTQNTPNPFHRVTTIRFELPTSTSVRLELFDLQGRRIRVLAVGERPAGLHSVEWDGRDERGVTVRPGVYLYRLSVGGRRLQQRTVLLD